MPVLVKQINVCSDTLSLISCWIQKRYILIFAVLALVFFMAVTSRVVFAEFAEKIPDLYKAEIPINSQTDREKLQIMGEALSLVLIKVTGETRSIANPQLKEAMNQPEKYVKGYSYRKDSVPPKQQYLQVEFIKESVNQLLRNSGIAIWGASRPATLFWLAVQNDYGRSILSGIAAEPIVSNLQQRFINRSLPMIFPLMDFDDTQAISTADIWGLFTDKITKASVRYGNVPILAGRLSVNNNLYDGRLSLIFREQQVDAEITRLNDNQLSLVAADLVGSILSKHYAVASLESKENPRLTVDNISNTADYNSLLNYLEKLTAVRSIFVARISGSTIELILNIDGYSSQLTDIIALSRRLRRLHRPAERADTEINSMLNYMWMPP